MNAARMALLGGVALACLLKLIGSGPVAAERVQSAHVRLWDTDRSVVFDALRQFIYAPSTKPEHDFVKLASSGNRSPVFARTPDGWQTWDNNEEYKGRVIYQGQDDFRVRISLEPIRSIEEELIDHVRYSRYYHIVSFDQLFSTKDQAVTRAAKCQWLKGNVSYTEFRYFGSGKHAGCVKLYVSDSPFSEKTLADFLSYLHRHYGKYEAVCQQAGAIQFRKDGPEEDDGLRSRISH